MLASSLGALLLLAAASSAGLFGKQVDSLRTEPQDDAGEALAELCHAARYAWCVQVPDSRHLVLYDSTGGQTRYTILDGALAVTRPDGSQGVVSSLITGALFTAQEVPRYREDAPVQRAATIWSKAAPLLALPQAYVVEPGEQLGLGFLPASAASLAGPVDGVTEQVLSASLGLLTLKLSAVAPAHGSLTLRLHRARGPGDARPDGPSLGQVTVALSGLPAALTTPDLGLAGLKNTTVVTPVSSGGRGRGGLLGGVLPDVTLLVLPPAVNVPIDLTTLGATVQPGRAYTLVLANTADDAVALEGYVLASESLSGVALGKDSAPSMSQPVSLPRSLTGTATMTRAEETTVARSVLVDLTCATGAHVSGTVAVLGSSLVPNPWLGAIPGEIGP